MSASGAQDINGDEIQNVDVPDAEVDSPIVSRTRSGRKLRTPAAKTPVRRTKKSANQDEPTESDRLPTEQSKVDSTSNQKSPELATEAPDRQGPNITESADSEERSENADLVLSDVMTEKENEGINKDLGSNVSTEANKITKKRSHSESTEKKGKTVPFGKPKSGRVWKERKTQRFSALLRDKPLCSSWEKKMQAKREKQLVKQFQQQLKDEQTREKEEKKKRRAENLKRRAENERKAEIVQVIKNTAKIKRMKKKQLRNIEKRDTLSMVQKTPPNVKKSS
ncbi:hypothetical protein DNTS_031396 [Danionella cerebrum]|uniref:Coiled-coil domain-containing protein 86 n=1 Tax=Danionella cerebrum TaxID=2873325 RepID=A0A553MMH6_9TELE|nr:hypothetical protein DNTS_031396 [Danionella translucida]